MALAGAVRCGVTYRHLEPDLQRSLFILEDKVDRLAVFLGQVDLNRLVRLIIEGHLNAAGMPGGTALKSRRIPRRTPATRQHAALARDFLSMH